MKLQTKTQKSLFALLATFMISLMSLTAIAYEENNATVQTSVVGSQEPIILTDDYTLTSDLVFSTHGFIIASDDITIDGNGYSITGSKSIETCEWITGTDPAMGTSGHGVLNIGYDNVQIINLEITNFATGIYLAGSGTNNVLSNRIENCSIHDNGLDDMDQASSESVTHGIHIVFTKESIITNNAIYNNQGTGGGCEDGGNGIYVHGGDSAQDNDIISNNEIYGNAKSGIWMKKQAEYNTILNNEVYENGNGVGIPSTGTPGGIVLRCKSSNYNTIQANHVYENNGQGIFVGGNHNTIEGNVIISNEDNGIKLGRTDGSTYNELYENYLLDHGNLDVFNIHEAGGNNIGDNNAGLTASNYQDASASQGKNFTYSPGPTQPVVSGEVDGKKGTTYTYTISAEQNPLFESDIWYYIDWGDGQTEEWTGPYTSGEDVDFDHSWDEKGTYQLKVKAKDSNGVETDWAVLPVTMPITHSLFSVIQHILFNLLDGFFNLGLFL